MGVDSRTNIVIMFQGTFLNLSSNLTKTPGLLRPRTQEQAARLVVLVSCVLFFVYMPQHQADVRDRPDMSESVPLYGICQIYI